MTMPKDNQERTQLTFTFAELREKERLFALALAEKREAEDARLRRRIQGDMFDLDQATPDDESVK
jgi:hypothetical protein